MVSNPNFDFMHLFAMEATAKICEMIKSLSVKPVIIQRTATTTMLGTLGQCPHLCQFIVHRMQ